MDKELVNSSGSQEIKITHIFAKGEHIPMNEITSKLIEKREPGPASNKWLHPSRDSWIEAEFSGPFIVKSYILQSANNVPERDPLEWRLIGKTVSGNWIHLSQQKSIFERRHLKKEFPVEVNIPVISVRLIIDKNNGDAYTQLARIRFMGNPYVPLFSKINNSRPAGTGIHAIRKLGQNIGGKRNNKTHRKNKKNSRTRRM